MLQFSFRTAVHAAALACGLLLVSGCSFGPRFYVESEDEIVIPIDALRGVTCNTHNGSVNVIGTDEALSEIRVAVKKRAGGDDEPDAKECMDAIEITRTVADGVLQLGWRWREDRPMRWQATVSFLYDQPVGTRATVETHNGSITVEGIEGGVHARTHNGPLRLEGCGGGIDATTHNGKIGVVTNSSTLRLKTHNGAIEARVDTPGAIDGSVSSHNGAVRIEAAPDASSRFLCSTHNGNLRTRGSLQVLEKGKRGMVVKVGDGSGSVTVETHNGGISISRAAAR